MAKTLDISIKCTHCNQWFPSPVWVSDSKSFDASILFGNLAECPHCKKMTGCNKENFRARFEDGSYLGNDT